MDRDNQIIIKEILSLLEKKQNKSLQDILSTLRSSDIAEIVEFVGIEDRITLMRLLDKPTAAEVLEKVDEATRSSLFDLLEDNALKDIINELDPDDAADILGELPEEESEEYLSEMEPEESAQIKDLMSYSEDSAGGIMDPVLVSAKADETVAQVIDQIREQEIDEDFFSIYITDDNGTFLGDTRIRSLLTSSPQTRMGDILESDTIYVSVDADQEEVRNLFSKNDLIVAPVLDENNKLVGRITADRIIEVAEEEAAEDIYVMAGTDADELDKTSIVHAARIRMTWLIPCLLGTGITALVMILFKNVFMHQDSMQIYALVIAFVPMIAAISGNAGLQTSAIVVCGLATGHLAAGRMKQVFIREARVALLVAVSCGIIGGTICTILQKLNLSHSQTIDSTLTLRVAIAFTIAMFSSIMVATSLGLLLPFFFRKVGIDPAISSGPLVTTANDSISVTIYLSLSLLLILAI